MKLIVTITLLALCFSHIAAENGAFSQKWCGNSKVDVEIQSGKDGNVKTMASIVVPTTLAEVTKYAHNDQKLIPKTEQGLVLTLDGKANAEHLGTIYNYDEDDNTQIFIPYLYLSSVSSNTDGMNVQMARSFKKTVDDIKFNIIPVNDAFGTALCECQVTMLLERIQQNLTKRFSVLTYIGSQIVKASNNLAYENREIIKWTNAKASKATLDSLRKQAVNKDKECNAYKDQITRLNSDISKDDSDLARKHNENIANDALLKKTKSVLVWWKKVVNTNVVAGGKYVYAGEKSQTEKIWAETLNDMNGVIGNLNTFNYYKTKWPKIPLQIVEATKQQTSLLKARNSPTLNVSAINAVESGIKLLLQENNAFQAKNKN